MAKASAKDPRSNIFELLADDSSNPLGDAPKKKGKAPEKKEDKVAAKPVVGATPTPAAQALARKQKEAEKTTTPTPKAEPVVVKEDKKTDKPVEDPDRKLSKEEWLKESDGGFKVVQSKKTKQELENQENQGGNNRPPRQGGEGGRGRGGRGGRRGGQGGRNRNGEPRPPNQRLDENRNRDYNQRGQDLSEGRQEPRGRDYDKKSGMVTGRRAPFKKQGAGQRNWGGPVSATEAEPTNQDQTTGWDDVPTTTPDVPAGDAAWGDENLQTKPAESNAEGATDATVQPDAAKPETPKEKSYDDYLKEKEQKQKELAEKLASLTKEAQPAPRQVEQETSDSLKPVENQRTTANDLVKSVDKPEKEAKVKKEKTRAVQVIDVNFKVKGMGRPPRGGRRGGPQREGETHEERPQRTERPERPERQERDNYNYNRGRGRGGRGAPRVESHENPFPSLDEALKA